MVVWFAHVRVGHRQHLILNPSLQKQRGVLFGGEYYYLTVTKVLLHIIKTFFIIAFQNFILYYHIVLFTILGL